MWKSKKQSLVARSSAKADCTSMTHNMYELLWLNGPSQLGFVPVPVPVPIEIGFRNKQRLTLLQIQFFGSG